ncbi:MAG: FAD-binding oxidoreductase [Myxococcota bacterium]|jgi:decaprenylphospho-beta-D-ribofuranose 2-oxidase|nr:FAD-binding oxidoreductase [Myxococcota bacterium]
MASGEVTDLAGWGNFPVENCTLYRPQGLEELRSVLGRRQELDFISRGQGRSYGDAALNARRGVILTHGSGEGMHLDTASGTLECLAGTTLAEILDYAVPRGYSLGITPGTKRISLGGAIAADVHGKNHHKEGTISHQLLGFSLLTAEGNILDCSREENSDLFWATLGGMGLTGVILGVRLALKASTTAYVTSSNERCRDLDDVLTRMEEGDRRYDYAVAWIDCLAKGRALGRSILMRANPAELEDLAPARRERPHHVPSRLRPSVPLFLPGWVLNPWSMRAFNAAFYTAHRNQRQILDFDRYFYALDRVEHWNRVYGRRGALQYQVVLPSAQAREGLVALLERIVDRGLASFLAVLKTTGPANSSPLSFPIEGVSLALDFPNTGAGLFSLLDDLDAVTLAHGGRVYLAKDSRLSPENFRAMYPRMDEFNAVKARYDPEGLFSSSLARRIGLAVNA